MSNRLLLIEDDTRLAEMVEDYLGKAGFRVEYAADAARGLALAARDNFDAIILDLMLPDMPKITASAVPQSAICTVSSICSA